MRAAVPVAVAVLAASTTIPGAAPAPPAPTPGAEGGAPSADPLVDSLRARLTRTTADLAPLYGDSAATPLWVTPNGLRDEARLGLRELQAAEREGLPPARYDVEALRATARALRRGGASPRDLAAFDVALTSSLRRLAHDVARGRLGDHPVRRSWGVDSTDAVLPPEPGASAVLTHLRDARPESPEYDFLQSHLARLRGLRDQGVELPPVNPGDRVLEAGDSGAVVRALRDRLARSMDPGERALAERRRTPDPGVLDSALVRGLQAFQARHGLADDGVLGPRTAEALNRTIDEHIVAARVALERWRWLPSELGTPAVLVNVAGQRVEVVEDGRPSLSMRAIVGQDDWQTELFQDRMERIVVNPYWNVPASIVAAETLPKARADEGYLRRNGFEVLDPETGEAVPLDAVDWATVDAESFPYRIRQRPGRGNALGTVKFLFPNRFAIYLHDTPADHLFDEAHRTFSHGCVRVAEPARLARYLLEHASDRAPDRYGELRATGERQVVGLDPAVPTYLVYMTLRVDDRGVPTYAPDVYGRDADVRNALEAATEAAPESPGTLSSG